MTTESSFRKLLSYQTINTFMKKFKLKVQVTKTELNDFWIEKHVNCRNIFI